MSQGIASILSTVSDTARLRLQAGNGEPVNDEVIQQFEALFLQQMLKSMRTASLSEGMFQSEQSEFYRDMYDQQIAADLAKQEILGIAQIINRQLGNNSSSQMNDSGLERDVLPAMEPQSKAENIYAYSSGTAVQNHQLSRLDALVDNLSESVRETVPAKTEQPEFRRPLAFKPESPGHFVNVAYQYAKEPAEKLGVEPNLLVAIAALETGWGRHVPENNYGSSNNYFGIKADNRWQGEQISSPTLEFEHGTFKEIKQTFRVYESIKDSFNDYANFLLANDRYSHALEFASDTHRFIREIHNAGYATDPDYADKIINVLQSKVFLSP